jgi:hypothetical protein
VQPRFLRDELDRLAGPCDRRRIQPRDDGGTTALALEERRRVLVLDRRLDDVVRRDRARRDVDVDEQLRPEGLGEQNAAAQPGTGAADLEMLGTDADGDAASLIRAQMGRIEREVELADPHCRPTHRRLQEVHRG